MTVTLIVKKDVSQQVKANTEIGSTGGMVKATQAMGGPERSYAVDLGGPVFGQGPATLPSLACLPLAVGHSTAVRNLDGMRQKPLIKGLGVVGLGKMISIISAMGGAAMTAELQ